MKESGSHIPSHVNESLDSLSQSDHLCMLHTDNICTEQNVWLCLSTYFYPNTPYDAKSPRGCSKVMRVPLGRDKKSYDLAAVLYSPVSVATRGMYLFKNKWKVQSNRPINFIFIFFVTNGKVHVTHKRGGDPPNAKILQKANEANWRTLSWNKHEQNESITKQIRGVCFFFK